MNKKINIVYAFNRIIIIGHEKDEVLISVKA
jgi:hypothetical protein